MKCSESLGCSGKCEDCEDLDALVDRLAAYEDTGLDPENMAHWQEFFLAECDGRLVVLPCKVGDTVYRIDPGNFHSNWKPFVHPITVDEISWKYAKTMKGKKDLGFAIIANGSRYKLSSIGKNVFLTHEEAEKVLEGGRSNG